MEPAYENVVFLTTQEVIVLHDMAIKNWGGRSGLLNFAALDAAVGRVKTALSYDEQPDPVHAACLYAHAISRNHGFADGNKRTAYAAMTTCLAVNGYAIENIEPEDMANLIIDLASGSMPLEEFEVLIRDIVRPDPTYQYIKDNDLQSLPSAAQETDEGLSPSP
jgi:death-on-curing family protein